MRKELASIGIDKFFKTWREINSWRSTKSFWECHVCNLSKFCGILSMG